MHARTHARARTRKHTHTHARTHARTHTGCCLWMFSCRWGVVTTGFRRSGFGGRVSSQSAVVLVGCRITGMMSGWDVFPVGCSPTGMTSGWDVFPVGCSPTGMTSVWDVFPVGCSPTGMTSGWDEFPMGCRLNRMSCHWDAVSVLLKLSCGRSHCEGRNGAKFCTSSIDVTYEPSRIHGSRSLLYFIREIKFVAKHTPHHIKQYHTSYLLKLKEQLL